jgi:hypothetical protein
MKGLSLTLTIVIIAIVLLVTALVIMTIFGGQMAQIIGILNPWSTAILESNLCQQKCATYCQLNPGTEGTDWIDLEVTVQGQTGPKKCDEVMKAALGQAYTAESKCECTGLKK